MDDFTAALLTIPFVAPAAIVLAMIVVHRLRQQLVARASTPWIAKTVQTARLFYEGRMRNEALRTPLGTRTSRLLERPLTNFISTTP